MIKIFKDNPYTQNYKQKLTKTVKQPNQLKKTKQIKQINTGKMCNNIKPIFKFIKTFKKKHARKKSIKFITSVFTLKNSVLKQQKPKKKPPKPETKKKINKINTKIFKLIKHTNIQNPKYRTPQKIKKPTKLKKYKKTKYLKQPSNKSFKTSQKKQI